MGRRWMVGRAFLTLAVLLVVCAPVSGRAQPADGASPGGPPLPWRYCGQAWWHHMPDWIHRIALTIDNQGLTEDGRITATGTSVYDAGMPPVRVDFRMTVDPRTESFEMIEWDPRDAVTGARPVPDFIVDGVHRGKIDEDFQTIEATWQWRATGQTAQIRLSTCADAGM